MIFNDNQFLPKNWNEFVHEYVLKQLLLQLPEFKDGEHTNEIKVDENGVITISYVDKDGTEHVAYSPLVEISDDGVVHVTYRDRDGKERKVASPKITIDELGQVHVQYTHADGKTVTSDSNPGEHFIDATFWNQDGDGNPLEDKWTITPASKVTYKLIGKEGDQYIGRVRQRVAFEEKTANSLATGYHFIVGGPGPANIIDRSGLTFVYTTDPDDPKPIQVVRTNTDGNSNITLQKFPTLETDKKIVFNLEIDELVHSDKPL